MFDQSRTLFYYLEANYTIPYPNPSGRPLTFWTIDPRTGLTTSTVVTGGAVNLPVAWYYHCEEDTIFVATQIVSNRDPNPEQCIGYRYWRVDPTTAVSALITEVPVPCGCSASSVESNRMRVTCGAEPER